LWPAGGLRLCGLSPFARLGAPVTLVLADAKQPPFGRVFDAVLIDVPCSRSSATMRGAP